jgi:hypothetical protein
MIDHDESLANDPLAALVRASAPERFESGFRDRVAARLHAERQPALPAVLQRQFLRIVPIAAAASLMLAAYNWWGARETSSSPIEAVLNLPQITLASAYSPSVLYGAAAADMETQ